MFNRYPAFRDGVEMWTEGDTFTAPGGEIVEVLYEKKTGGEKSYFVELPGIPTCAHGDSVTEAIDAAREKQAESKPLTDEDKEKYRAENFKFSVSLFIRITKACRSGAKAWLKERGLDSSVTMTLKDFRKAGGGQWADELARRIK